MSIETSEFRVRQRRLAESIRTRHLDGVLVVSRGGGTFDRSADVLYLTGHYQSYAYLPETPGLFSGRSHAVLVFTASGQSVLCVSTPEFDADRIVADDVRYSEDFAATIAKACRDLGLQPSRLGLIGADVLPLAQWTRLRELLGGDLPSNSPLPALDGELAELRRTKSPGEQDLVRAAAATCRQAVTAFLGHLAPGRTEAEAVGAAAQVVYAAGAGLYFAAVSSGPDTHAYTGTPLPGFGRRQLAAGDLVRLDLGIMLDGYLADFGRTVVVGEPTADQCRLIETLTDVLDVVIEAVRPELPVRDLVAIGDQALRDAGVVSADRASPGTIGASYPAHWGHGLGLGWERPWLVADEPLTLEAGMVLAVERALTLDEVGTAAAEQNLLVTDSGYELLTCGPTGRWS